MSMPDGFRLTWVDPHMPHRAALPLKAVPTSPVFVCEDLQD
jgi:hypothetical protein